MINLGRHWHLRLFRSLMRQMSWLRGAVIQSEWYILGKSWPVLSEEASLMLLSGLGTLPKRGRMRIILWRSFLYGNDRG